MLTLLVSSKPLVEDAKLSMSPMIIDPGQLETWEKQWAVTPPKFEMEGGVGQTLPTFGQALRRFYFRGIREYAVTLFSGLFVRLAGLRILGLSIE